MRGTPLLCSAVVVVAITLVGRTCGARKPANSVLLSNIQTLTLRKDARTSHRRVSAIPQLNCIGGSAKRIYEVDVMRCKNQGSDYNEANIQWTCTASLPPEFKLGSTDVMCEGYDSPEDPYILKGSCGVEYRLMLTELGEQKYGRQSDLWGDFKRRGRVDWSAIIFWLLFLGVVGWIVYSAIMSYFGRPRAGRPPGGNNNQPWGWGGGGGGGGGDDPPPPYDYQPPRKPYAPSSRPYRASSNRQQGQSQQGWRPGFWTGALGGGAAAYLAGVNRARNAGSNNTTTRGDDGSSWFGGGRGRDVGEGSSRWGGGGGGGGSWRNDGNGPSSSSSSSSSSFSSTRYESTGFGSTGRR